LLAVDSSRVGCISSHHWAWRSALVDGKHDDKLKDGSFRKSWLVQLNEDALQARCEEQVSPVAAEVEQDAGRVSGAEPEQGGGFGDDNRSDAGDSSDGGDVTVSDAAEGGGHHQELRASQVAGGEHHQELRAREGASEEDSVETVPRPHGGWQGSHDGPLPNGPEGFKLFMSIARSAAGRMQGNGELLGLLASMVEANAAELVVKFGAGISRGVVAPPIVQSTGPNSNRVHPGASTRRRSSSQPTRRSQAVDDRASSPPGSGAVSVPLSPEQTRVVALGFVDPLKRKPSGRPPKQQDQSSKRRKKK